MSSADIAWDALQGRSVIITGGASGLGAATATKMVQHGAYVTIADMSDDLGTELVRKLGEKATYVHCNTTDWESSAAAFKHAANHAPSKTLDVAVLFAGVGGESKGLIDIVLEQPMPDLDSDTTPAEPAHKAIDVNLLGVYISTYLALQYFRLPAAQPQTFTKSLVLISSMMGYIDGPYNTGYAVSKFGVRGLFCSLRSQAHKLNARINNVAPGYILTPLTQRVHEIERPDQPSKATGLVLPWASIDHVVDGVGRCAVDENTTGE
jgi:5'-hydroxyaverantin dehydrogenase